MLDHIRYVETRHALHLSLIGELCIVAVYDDLGMGNDEMRTGNDEMRTASSAVAIHWRHLVADGENVQGRRGTIDVSGHDGCRSQSECSHRSDRMKVDDKSDR